MQRKKTEQEELKRKEEKENQRKEFEEEKAQIEKARLEAERKKLEKEKENERRRRKEELEQQDAERKKPLPDAILLEIRTHLLTSGSMNKSQLQELQSKASLIGVTEDRFKYNFKLEVENYGNKTDPIQQPEQLKGNRWLFPLVFVLALVILIGSGYIFRSNLLNQFDMWGMKTTLMREWLNMPILPSSDSLESLTNEEEPEGYVDKAEERTPGISDVSSQESNEERWEASEQNKNRDIITEVKTAKKALETEENGGNPSEPKEPKSYTIVDKSPVFPGGNKALLTEINNSIIYPRSAKMSGISGTVYVEYIVSTTGDVKQAVVVKGVHPLLDKEAVRVVSGLTGFKSAKKNGIRVHYKSTIPVRFVLTK